MFEGVSTKPKSNMAGQPASSSGRPSSSNTATKWTSMVTGKSPEEVKRNYEILLENLNSIEEGKVPFPKYKSSGS